MDVVVVSGASKGLGLGICKRLLASDKYIVVGVSRTLSDEFKNLQSRYQDRLFYISYDFLNTQGIQSLVKQITKEHGAVYALINNAALGIDGVLGTMHERQISDLLKVNVEAPILLTKYISRSMLTKLRGRIINISSIIASTGFNGLCVYGATKSAMQGFTKSLARELGKANIMVNSISPGYMQTDMTGVLQGDKLESIKRRSPLKRLANVDDVAAMVLFLLSDDASSITGANFTVDVGSTA
ncbi:SDR family NAD(P)-dependent oxidoreductase [Campylobacter suis]|uniref:3-oxoacyl-[acyl-carrier-protein] reductase FabG n=1 Tax=Campylobacter suis TaxID=2790657 RepID=A0ABM8Q6Z5_9BACT|nr:SDR family oxidoreductase [Campylobacter suis]CAD7288713.1 3-oxoacyl-[acyl-carrier-protein] reductase FabG [Campylobacter suis]